MFCCNFKLLREVSHFWPVFYFLVFRLTLEFLVESNVQNLPCSRLVAQPLVAYCLSTRPSAKWPGHPVKDALDKQFMNHGHHGSPLKECQTMYTYTPPKKTMYIRSFKNESWTMYFSMYFWSNFPLSDEENPNFPPTSRGSVEITTSLVFRGDRKKQKKTLRWRFVVKYQALVTCWQHQSHNSQSCRFVKKGEEGAPWRVQVLLQEQS